MKRSIDLSGFTLVESMIATALLLSLLVAVTQVTSHWSSRRSYNMFFVARDRILSQIRNNLENTKTFNAIAKDPRNLDLQGCVFAEAYSPGTCLSRDLASGSSVSHPMVVKDFSSDFSTGLDLSGTPTSPVYYNNFGAPCTLAMENCSLQVTTAFEAVCPPTLFTNTDRACQRADRIQVSITIGPVPGSGLAIQTTISTVEVFIGKVAPIACPGGKIMRGFFENGRAHCNAWMLEFEGPVGRVDGDYYGPGSYNQQTKLMLDSLGNLLITGSTDGWFSHSSPLYIASMSRNGLCEDCKKAYVAKFTPDMKPLWATQFSTSTTDSWPGAGYCDAISDAVDNIFLSLTDVYSGPIHGGTTCETEVPSKPKYSCFAYVVGPPAVRYSYPCCNRSAFAKVDSSGNKVWLSAPFYDPVGKAHTAGSRAALDGNGNLFVAASFQNCFMGTCAPGVQGIILGKLDTDGNLIPGSTTVVGPSGTGVAWLLGMAAGADHTAYFSGKTTGTISTDGSTGPLMLGRLNQDGTLRWLRQYSPSPVVGGAKMITDSLGNLFVVSTGGPYSYTATVLKLDPDGNQIWVQNLSDVSSVTLVPAEAGNFILGGTKVVMGPLRREFKAKFLKKLDSAGNQLAALDFADREDEYDAGLTNVVVNPTNGEVTASVSNWGEGVTGMPGVIQPIYIMKFDRNFR